MNEVLRENISQNNTSPVINTKEFLEKELDFWYKKYKQWDIDSDKFDDIHDEIDDIVDDYEDDLAKLQEKYQELKQDILKQTWLELEKEWKINDARNNIYDYFWINKITYRNDTIDRFKKWLIDGLFVNNAELIDQVIETNWMILIDWLKNLLTPEWIWELLKWLWNTILDLFSWDAYEKWISACDLWLIWSWITLWYKWIKAWIKTATKNTLKLKNKIVLEENILTTVHKTKKDKVDIQNLDSENKAIINEMITNNFPLVEITRITSNQNIVNFSIWWIKWLNDTFGQAFCDKLLFELKQGFRDRFENSRVNWWFDNRVLKDDYKNITFLNNSKEIAQDIFSDIKYKSQVIENLLTNLNKEIYSYAREFVYEELKTKNISYSSKKEFDLLVSKKASEIKTYIRENLSFWVWKVEVKWDIDDIEKLNLIRKAETASKLDVENWILSIWEYSHDVIIWNIKNSQEILQKLKTEYLDKKFEFNWVKYDIFKNWKLTPEILRYVRKNPWEIKPQKLETLVKNYYSNLNASLDFISPVKWDLENIAFKEAHRINNQIREWVVDKRYFCESFKWWLSKKFFFESVKQLDWKAIFVDIKDMWIDNIFDFQKRAEKILKIQNDIDIWIITPEIWIKEIENIMLEAWKDVTKKFSSIQENIARIYPEALISLGWDEIYIFLPKKFDNPNIITDVKEIVNSTNQNARVIYRETKQWQNKVEVFDFLDKFSKINKSLEVNLEKVLKKKNIDLIINSNSLSFSDEVLAQVSRSTFNFDELLNKFNDFLNVNYQKIFTWQNIIVTNLYEWIDLKIYIENWNISIKLQ